MHTLKRCIAQAYDEKHIELARHFVPKMDEWCNRHGWSHVIRRVKSWDHDHDHDYRKHLLVQELLVSHDIVVWSDTDIIPVSGEDFVMPHEDVHFSCDTHGLCAGFMAYRSNQWTVNFVSGLTSVIPKRGAYRTHEQDCLKSIILIGDCVNHVRMLPETIVANPCSPSMQVPPVFFHAWSNTGVKGAIDRATHICNFNKAQ
jgi:hypothetical protein